MMAFVGLPFYFQTVMGRTAVETGLLMTPWPIAVGIAAPLAGRLADRHRAGTLGGIGLSLFAVGLYLLSRVHPGVTNLDIAWRMALCGVGFGFFQAPNNRGRGHLRRPCTAARRGRRGPWPEAPASSARRLASSATAVFFHLAGTHATTTALATASGPFALGFAWSAFRG